ncbi:Isonitrile hydratase [Cytospora mali]|uniref:Isonitrile hydratase n=1 Tax=Cytospora mali TaxID=578113 RepID=A0A194VSW3_CYTMA|nr:Isonitrile hydratase [Valsa mali]
MTRKHLHIGVFIPSPSAAQLLDLACVDIFAMMSHQYLHNLPMLPSHLTSLAPDITISYISATTTTTTPSPQKDNTTPAPAPLKLTANLTIQPTHHFTDPAVAPGNLDIVLVPGPDPRDTWPAAPLAWLRQQSDAAGTDILSVCTGLFICGAAGLLDGGRRACGPRGLQAELRGRYPRCELVGGALRWVRDGNLWSSGGVTNGNDLVAAYCRADARFPGPVVGVVLATAEVGDRPQRYGRGGQAGFMLGMVWQLVRAWFMGGGKGKGKGKERAD